MNFIFVSIFVLLLAFVFKYRKKIYILNDVLNDFKYHLKCLKDLLHAKKDDLFNCNLILFLKNKYNECKVKFSKENLKRNQIYKLSFFQKKYFDFGNLLQYSFIDLPGILSIRAPILNFI